MQMAHDENRARVAPLSDLNDYEVSDHDPDVRGWDVLSADGRKIGEVEDLIVDTGAMKVRYLDVEVDKDYRADKDHRILIPVGQARLHESEDHVHVNALSSNEVKTFPAYQGRLDRSYEDTVHQRFGSSAAGASSAAGRDYYSSDNFDDNRFYGSRRGSGSPSGRSGDVRGSQSRDDRMTLSEEKLAVGRERHEAGEVRVGKHVETEHVKKEVPVTRERATVERRPIEGDEARHARASISDDEIRVPLTEEEVVVEKRTVPKEELVVKKYQEQDTETVEADLRRERADIEGDVDEKNRGRSDRR
jgi:photosynthetic reaction center H subunit